MRIAVLEAGVKDDLVALERVFLSMPEMPGAWYGSPHGLSDGIPDHKKL